ncbi:MAG: glycine/sarcosine/betaine reductase component B subunit [Nitrospirota bacterium]
MRLEVQNHIVRTVEFGSDFGLSAGVLYVNPQYIKKLVGMHTAIREVCLDITRPGESARIINPLDAVEPIAKTDPAPLDVFPGYIGPSQTVGNGVTHRLQGLRIVQCARFPHQTTGVLTVRPVVIDMTGPAAPLCACSDTINLVLTFIPNPEATNYEFDVAMRAVTLQIVHHLARLSLELKPDEVEIFETSNSSNGRPRIVYICQVQDQGELVQTFLYGQSTRIHTPTILSSTEMLDGAIVSGNYKNAMKIPTFMHCRNPVCLELFRIHGKEISFAGVILTRGHNDNHALKERSAYFAAKLAQMVRADGAIVSIEGTGNTIIDAMLTVRACETAGIKTVLKVHEHAGLDGRSFPVADFVEEADMVVSTGNLDEPIVIPAVDKVIGPLPLEFYGKPLIDPWKGGEVTGHELYASQWQMGVSGYSCLSL